MHYIEHWNNEYLTEKLNLTIVHEELFSTLNLIKLRYLIRLG